MRDELVPLAGTLDVLVWNKADSGRQALSLTDPGTLPLRPQDKIQITAKLNRPAYVYVIAVDSHSQAIPVYPWETATGRIDLPRKRRRTSCTCLSRPRKAGYSSRRMVRRPLCCWPTPNHCPAT